MTRVVACSPVRLYREGLAEVLERDGEVNVVGVAAGAAECLAAAERWRPSAVLLDAATPRRAELIRALARLAPAPRVVAIAVPEDEGSVVELAEAGVAGYVTYDDSLCDLVAAVRAAHSDEVLCSPRTAAILLRRVTALAEQRDHAAPSNVPAAVLHLTPRELQIVALIDEGLSNKQIARRLVIEIPTVKNHVHNILEKLGVERRGQAAALLHAVRAHGERLPLPLS